MVYDIYVLGRIQIHRPYISSINVRVCWSVASDYKQKKFTKNV